MKVKRFLWFYTALILFSTLNFSAKTYTREDLEKIQNWVAVTDLVFTVPFLASENPSDARFCLMIPAAEWDNILLAALESSNLTSLVTSLARFSKLALNPRFSEKLGLRHPLLLFVLAIVSYNIIMKTYSGDKNRVKRRILRSFVFFAIDVILSLDKTNQYCWNQSQDNVFLATILRLIRSLVEEYIGEQIICGATVMNHSKNN